MPDPKGSEDVYEIELLRSLEWIRKIGAAPRRFIEIELAEMGLNGLAKVESITACPAIKSGSGRVVLMTVTHMDSGVMEIEFDGLKKALEPTVSHPLFSADRKDWAPAGLLNVGERIKTRTGTSQIKAIRWKKGEHRVYNFEVEADHAYFVSEEELLTHNSGVCPNPNGKLGGPLHQKKAAQVEAQINNMGGGITAKTEVKVTGTKGKSHRYADKAAVDQSGQVIEYHQVGKQTKKGLPVKREMEAAADISAATGKPVVFHAYN